MKAQDRCVHPGTGFTDGDPKKCHICQRERLLKALPPKALAGYLRARKRREAAVKELRSANAELGKFSVSYEKQFRVIDAKAEEMVVEARGGTWEELLLAALHKKDTTDQSFGSIADEMKMKHSALERELHKADRRMRKARIFETVIESPLTRLLLKYGPGSRAKPAPEPHRHGPGCAINGDGRMVCG
jgi:hypothetical protein